MKQIRYKLVGGVGGKTKREGTVGDLYISIPYMGLIGLIPPYEVARDLFLRGSQNAGMSGGVEWPPFSMTEEEYQDFALDLETRPRSDVTPHGFSREPVNSPEPRSWDEWILRAASTTPPYLPPRH